MILLTTAVLLACLPQTVLQVQQREIHEQGIYIKYPEIANADQFNATVHQTVGSLTERFKKEMVGGSAPDSSPSRYVNGSYNAAILKNA